MTVDPMYDARWRLSEVRSGAPHNLIAHPLLVLWPRVGEWLHEATAEVVPTWRARWRHRGVTTTETTEVVFAGAARPPNPPPPPVAQASPPRPPTAKRDDDVVGLARWWIDAMAGDPGRPAPAMPVIANRPGSWSILASGLRPGDVLMGGQTVRDTAMTSDSFGDVVVVTFTSDLTIALGPDEIVRVVSHPR